MGSRTRIQTYLPALLIALFFVQGAYALSEPVQQSNKIFLEPFYRASMAQNTNFTYNVTVRPDEGISKVVSAILTFDMWITPTVTFTAWVNGQACNNPTYVISTTFAASGRGVATFDCTNVINKTGSYVVTLRASGANVGASTAWLDITYKNNPAGNVKVHGTEYIPGDVAKMFLQFLDATDQPVTNSECFLTVYYPNDTVLLNDSLMVHLNNASEGIYYKNFNVPNVLGVYPASAKCYKPLTFNNIILDNAVTDGFESGNFTGGIGWANDTANATPAYGWDVEDTIPLAYVVTNATAAPCYAGAYCAKLTGSYGFIERGIRNSDGLHQINLTFAFKIKGFQTNEHMDFFVFDGNWHLIDKIGNMALYGGYTNNVWYNKTYVLTESEYEFGNMLIGWYATKETPSTSDEMYIDSISMKYIAANITISNNTDYQVLRGSGEVHVSGLYSALNSSLINIQNSTVSINNSLVNFANITAEAVWNFSGNKTVTADSLFVGGTEYFPGDSAKISARITSGANPVTGATCNVTIAYPNQTSLFVNFTAMTEVTLIGQGVYVYSFTAPSTLGVYTYAVDCVKTGSKYYLLDTFHVNNNTGSANNDLLVRINTTTTQINSTVTTIQNQTSLISQIWTWVQGIFNWVGTDSDANATTSVTTNNITATVSVQTVQFVAGQYYTDQSNSVIAQVVKDGASVTGATCKLNLFRPNMVQTIVNGTMTFTGIDGMYNYTWVPDTYGSHIAQVACTGGTLSGQVQTSGSLGVSSPSTGYNMQVIS